MILLFCTYIYRYLPVYISLISQLTITNISYKHYVHSYIKNIIFITGQRRKVFWQSCSGIHTTSFLLKARSAHKKFLLLHHLQFWWFTLNNKPKMCSGSFHNYIWNVLNFKMYLRNESALEFFKSIHKLFPKLHWRFRKNYTSYEIHSLP